jgi:hypothetical protein
MTFPLTREQALAAAKSAAAERDTIQSNLLDLDGSFGKRLLAGATLTGESRSAWDTASAALAALWDTFTAYSAIIDRANEMLAVPGRITPARLSEVAGLLNGPSVTLTKAAVPLSQRELTSGGQTRQTLLTTVREMRRSFSEVAAVVTAAESVWNEISDGIRLVTTDIETAKAQLPGLGGDAELTGSLDQAQASLRDLRELLNSDPLALWRGSGAGGSGARAGTVDTAPLERLRKQAAAVTSQVAELARFRADADRRLAEISSAIGAAQQAHQDATVARSRAASRINLSAANSFSPLPDVSGLASRVGALPALKAAGRWTRLASELDVIGKQAAAVTKQCQEAEQAAAGLVGQRNELRGLLDSYHAMAGGLGAAENAELDAIYQQAKQLLWTAPCDLEAATAAVNGYQQAVLRLRRSGGRR